MAGTLGVLWMLFVLFTVYFFRDPSQTFGREKPRAGAGHGKVDTIDLVSEPEFLGGECRRISISSRCSMCTCRMRH